MENVLIELNDVYELKKKHPCGSNRWVVIRTGADIKIKCLGCGRVLLMDRVDFKKQIKSLISKNVNSIN